MSEREWLECTDPGPMLEFLKDQASDRKLRLFAVACCRQIPSLFPDLPSRKALDLIERFSDGQANAKEFWSQLDFGAAEVGGGRVSQAMVMKIPAWWRITMALRDVRLDVVIQLAAELRGHSMRQKSISQCCFVRCVFGNPFQPVTLKQSWLMPDVIGMAQQIYDHRELDRLPILAYALEEAGCDNAEILTHCREPGPHVLGCWVVDLILGKK